MNNFKKKLKKKKKRKATKTPQTNNKKKPKQKPVSRKITINVRNHHPRICIQIYDCIH